MSKSYVLVADVLGFSQIMRNVPEALRAERVRKWLSLAERADGPDLRYQVVSDTLLVTAPPTEAGLQTLVRKARYLLEQGTLRNLPLRGAIALGDVEWLDNGVWGPGIVSAYELGQRTDWIGVTLDPSVEPIPDGSFRDRSLVTYPPPLKRGKVVPYANVRWAAPPASALAGYTTGGFLSNPQDVVDWSWLRKVRGTSDFRMYLDLLDAAQLSTDRYHGVLGADLQESFINFALQQLSEAWAGQMAKQNSAPQP